MNFTVSGKIVLGTEERTFVKSIDAKSENDARQRTYSLFGSLNGLERNKIKIEKVEKS